MLPDRMRTVPVNPASHTVDPTTAAEQSADPFRLSLPDLIVEEWRLRAAFIGMPRPSAAVVHRLVTVEAALRQGGAR